MRRSSGGIAIAAAVGLGTAVVFAQIPVDGGSVAGSTTVVDNSAGEQIDPHVSGNLAAYTDQAAGSGVIRYYDFLTPGCSGIIPSGDVWDVDASPSGNFDSDERDDACVSAEYRARTA